MRVSSDLGKVGMERNSKTRKQERSKKGAPAFFDYLVVIDFEATCFGKDNSDFCQEIIQFPAVLIDSKSKTIKDEFCLFVKPVINPKLTEYCTNLTGITQEMVDNAVEFVDALRQFEEWLLSHELGSKYTFMIVTDGSYDMGRFLYKQCQVSGIKYPSYASRWLNIRKAYHKLYRVKWYNLKHTLEMLGETFEGRPHDGLDDALNIAKVVKRFLENGGEAIENERILLDAEAQKLNGQLIQNDRSVLYGLDTVQNISRSAFFRYHNKGMKDEEVNKILLQLLLLRDDGETGDMYDNYRGKENIMCRSPPGPSVYAFFPDPMFVSYIGSPPMTRVPYAVHCRVNIANHMVPPPPYMPVAPYHSKYFMYNGVRRDNHSSAHYASEVPTNKTQRPPGKFRRAVEALEK